MQPSSFHPGISLGPWRPAWSRGIPMVWRELAAEPPEPPAAAAPSEPDPPQRPLVFTEEEVARLAAGIALEVRRQCAEACRARLERLREEELARMAARIEELARSWQHERRKEREELAALLREAVLALGQKLLVRTEAEAVEATVREWIARLLPDRPVQVVVRPELRDRLAARWAADAGGEGAVAPVEFVADAGLDAGDLRLVAGDGRIERRGAVFVRELAAALEACVRADPPPEAEEVRVDGETPAEDEGA